MSSQHGRGMHLAAAMADGSDTLTYFDLERRSVKLARLLRASGLGDGDRVAILMENRLDWLIAMWAARRASLMYVPINWHLKADEIRYVVEDSDARAIITSDLLLDAAADAIQGLDAIILRLTVGTAGRDFRDVVEATEELSDTPPANERDGGPMPYSSGTSGRPKGILRPPELTPFPTLNRTEALLGSLYDVDEKTVYLSPAPQYHSSPLGFTSLVLVRGGTVVLMGQFNPQDALDAIARWKVTHVQFVPTHFVRMLKLPAAARSAADLSSLRKVIHAAAPCSLDVKEAMIDWLGPIVFEYYSGSERCGMTAIDTPEWLTHRGSVGRTRTGKIHIIDPDSGKEVEPRAEGLVYFENPVPFQFHKQPEKMSGIYNEQGWGTHGDLGWVDPEGYLYLVDRLSNMIISGGVNIYPQEIENVLIGHPAVAEVAVIGVPNPEFGEEVKAVVQLDPEVDPSQHPSEELIAFCRSRLAGYKCPKTVDYVDQLPRHPNGKLMKRELRARYWPTANRI